MNGRLTYADSTFFSGIKNWFFRSLIFSYISSVNLKFTSTIKDSSEAIVDEI